MFRRTSDDNKLISRRLLCPISMLRDCRNMHSCYYVSALRSNTKLAVVLTRNGRSYCLAVVSMFFLKQMKNTPLLKGKRERKQNPLSCCLIIDVSIMCLKINQGNISTSIFFFLAFIFKIDIREKKRRSYHSCVTNL